VTLDGMTPPCMAYGSISTSQLHAGLSGTTGGWGWLLTDKQDMQDSGRCSVFEGTQNVSPL